MVNLEEIEYWQRASKGKVIQVLITAFELEKLMNECFVPHDARYTLIAYDWDRSVSFNYFEAEVSDLTKLVNKGITHFFLRSHKITPHLKLPENPITGGSLRSAINKWLIYLGLIDIKCNVSSVETQLKPNSSTTIMHIDKCYDIRSRSEIVENTEYGQLFLRIKSELAKSLHHKTLLKMENGKIVRAKRPDVSQGIYDAVVSGSLILPSNLDIE